MTACVIQHLARDANWHQDHTVLMQCTELSHQRMLHLARTVVAYPGELFQVPSWVVIVAGLK